MKTERGCFIETFKSPGAEYRGKPLWSWNGRLEEDELRRQIRIFRQMGLGGFFMHPRFGLETPYLSDQWFRLVNACVDEAKRQGLDAWLYDEDRFPSGTAGGLVTRNLKYCQQFLRMEFSRSCRWAPEVLAVFVAEIRDKTAWNVRRIHRDAPPSRLRAEETFLIFRVVSAKSENNYNGTPYLDTLSHAAVRRFITVTHKAYAKHCGRHFGRIIPGIFADELAHCGMFYEEGGSAGAPQGSSHISWTRKLPAVFRRRYGYDLMPHLVEIFFDVGGHGITPARYHYHECVAYLVVDACARQIGEWCARHGLQFTGHPMASISLTIQAQSLGNAMRVHEYMQAPGMDMGGRSRAYNAAKQVGSAARQFGWHWRLSETGAGTGWDFPFCGHKAMDDWQAALGINLRCQHLAFYTMEGLSKRDYPASISYQSPWWACYAKVEDYFARVHAAMSRGVEVRDILVIHPVESVWLFLKYNWFDTMEPFNRLDRRFTDLSRTLLQAHLDFDFGDEDILSRHGHVRRGNDPLRLQVGKADYRVVVVPPMTTMRASTLRLLQRFVEAGGSVVFAGAPAKYVDAVASPEPSRLAKRCLRSTEKGPALATAVTQACGRRVSITDTAGAEIATVLYLLREDVANFHLFVCNTGHKPSQLKGDFDKTMPFERTASFDPVFIRGFPECAGRPLEPDAETGAIFTATATRSNAGWEIRTSLPALGSRLFTIPKRKQRKRYPLRPVYRQVSRHAIGRRDWPVILSEPNVLVLDRPRYRIAAGSWRAADDILRVDNAVREALGIPHRSVAAMQPWTRDPKKETRQIPIELSYAFDITVLPSAPLFLTVERPAQYRILINDTALSTDCDKGWWVDASLRKIPLDRGILCKGRNEIRLACEYGEHHRGLEIIYLLGAFGVRLNKTALNLTASLTTLRTGDWVKQGLPFYSGSVSYCTTIAPKLQTGERVWVSVPEYAGTAVRVIVNDRQAGVIGWEPNEVDITDYLTGQAADLRIEVISHRRNSHGPLHFHRKWPDVAGPYEFASTGKQWVDRYQLVPCGLMARPQLVVRRKGKSHRS